MTTGLKLVLVAAEILTILSALFVTFHTNILYASIGLLFAFLGVAFMFVYAGADFLAGIQVIVYVGGVTILILFAIMLTQWIYNTKLRDVRTRLFIPTMIIAPVMAYTLYLALDELATAILRSQPQNFETFSNSPKTAVIGQALLSTYVLPFEAITILLLGALVGGVWLARPK